MEGISKNTAKSLLGRNVNLHLKDGSVIVNVLMAEIHKDDSVIVNVLLAEIHKDEFKRKAFVKCVPYGRKNTLRIPLKNIAWAELLNLNLILAGVIEPSDAVSIFES